MAAQRCRLHARGFQLPEQDANPRLTPQPLPDDQARVREVVASYENDIMTLTIGTDGQGCGSRFG
jgi:hypothetical protein